MRFHLTPEPLLFLITTFLLAPKPVAASPQPTPTSSILGWNYNELFARWDCGGTLCGYSSQLCCKHGHGCYTNAKTQAECTPQPSGSGWAGGASGGASASASGGVVSQSASFSAAPSQSVSTTKSPASPGNLGTSVSSAAVTVTSNVPYVPPVAGGSNVTMTEISGGSSLSGGAIAGIVVGVLVGLLILGIICFYCCIKGIWDGCLAIFGVGRKRKVTEVDEYTRRTHHSSGGERRTWYGAPVKTKTKVKKEESHLGRDLLGMGAGLAGLWAILGLKRRRENRKNDEKYSEYSYSSDYYTSESSASSDDRRSGRYTHSVRRSGSRRP